MMSRLQTKSVNVPNSICGNAKLHELLSIGMRLHDSCDSGTFVDQITHGYYYYERKDALRTDAIAAMAAACGMPINNRFFSYSEAVTRIYLHSGIDISRYLITHPITGAKQSIAEVVASLYDKYHWSREFVCELFRRADL